MDRIKEMQLKRQLRQGRYITQGISAPEGFMEALRQEGQRQRVGISYIVRMAVEDYLIKQLSNKE